MARRPQDVTGAELSVLRALWEEGPLTIRQLTDRVYPRGGASEYATVQKLLERLEDKGHVSHRSEGRPNLYAARVGRQDLVARRLREMAEQLCDGSLTPLLTHLVSAGRLTPDEVRELRRMVDRLARER
ncbi:MAG TPA: BlaI/MecI/CopY family transcriptional regulator [Vicinamibacteria bacterium]|nr:BlaI/MecI/CopY family transcriptional regulator [Vicinamibacteria bacterium]